MQIDFGNAMVSGADATPFLEKYPGRAVTLHLKEWSEGSKKAVVGEGVIDWKRILSLAGTVGGTEWLIVEQEVYSNGPLECVRRCIENLKKMTYSVSDK